jgi:hypothetical protein
LFGGIPNTDNFMKNLNTNLYTEPDKIINAIEICVHEEELNRNYIEQGEQGKLHLVQKQT